ncbi:MAG: DPP IV N-terminal domain-containing protein [Alistipes sp.]|nr:DPP IV N-terminal domain-containing protein [Alistipes sp.]
MTFKRLTVMIATIITAAFTTQARYTDILKIRQANSGIGALRSMRDGEHFTTLSGKHLLRSAYSDTKSQDTLFVAPFAVAGYTLSADEQMVLFPEAASVEAIYRHSFTASYALMRGATELARFEAVRDVTFSPDNSHIAYCKQNNLYLYNIATKATTAVTTDGKWNSIINGTSDWVYEEEYGFTQAYAFSTDGSKIAYLRFDESAVPTFEMMRYDDKLYNHAYSFKYPKAGDCNSTVELYLYDIATAKSSKVDVGSNSDQYIFNVSWTPGGELYFYRVNRLQNLFEVVLQRAGGSQKVIYAESSPRYVERPSGSTVTFIDADRFVVREETTTGWMHLYLHSVAKGRLSALTSGRWEVTSLVGYDGKRLYYTSTERSPLERDLYSVRLNGKCKQLLTTERGYNTIAPSAGMKYYIRTFSNANTPNIITVHRADGKTIDTLADRREAVSKAGTLATKQFRQFVTERGDTLNYYIQLPKDFDSTKLYPVLLTQYSGPGSQSVANRWGADWEDALTSRGYIVACCDGRGTGFRGEEFKKCTYADLGRREYEDQLSFARYLATKPYIDRQRIGIYGWSYGGFMALNCALHGEGLFKMAIAVAPVTSWRYYDTIYTEIYNGLPQDNPQGYDDNSPLSHAEKLSPRTRLIIIHGTADDNVHFQNSMEMCRRLNAAGKQYDMMVYPDQNHSMRPSATTIVRQKMIDYTVENL